MMLQLAEKQQSRLTYWYPALLAGATAWVAFLWVGNTPLLRATALSIVIIGVSLCLRRLGAAFAYVGGLVLAFSPAYWSQVGGPPTVSAWLVLLFILAGGGMAALVLRWNRRVFLSFAVGITVFVGLYLLFGTTQRSLRLTTILAAWLLYMLITALRQTNPRPNEPPATPLSKPHIYGVLLMMTLGVLNDPLFTLFIPAASLGLWLSHARLPRWYWLALAVLTVYGLWGIGVEYVSLDWGVRSSFQMHIAGVSVPYIVFDGWREPVRWLYITGLMSRQFTFVGVVLGVVGIARMSRWYPTLGVTLMIAYASYGVFGLVYFGSDIEILLLPMLMIQTIWMTYAVHAALQWAQRLTQPAQTAPAAQ